MRSSLTGSGALFRHHWGRAALVLLGCLALGGQSASGAVASEPDACARAYHDELRSIGARELAGLSAAREVAFEGDAGLAGGLLFTPPRGQHSEAEMAALREANELARRQGRAAWASSADNRWIADRIRTDLTEYLGQPASPYLCGGVPHYLEALRSYLERIGGASPAQRDERLAAQRAATARSVHAALAALKPAPLPRYAPSNRPMPNAISGLRPSAGLERSEDLDRVETRSVETSPEAPHGPPFDPDLPPLGTVRQVPLDTAEQRVATLDALMKEVGRIVPRGMTPVPGSAAPQGIAEARPVLDRLAALKPLVVGSAAPIGDPLARPRLIEAFSDIEVLDYLARAQTQGPDPLLGAIAATLDAIEAAHAASCTCGD